MGHPATGWSKAPLLRAAGYVVAIIEHGGHERRLLARPRRGRPCAAAVVEERCT
jgi:hypothetical protein